MSVLSSTDSRKPLTLTVWLILAMASIGFAFDIYVLLVLPLILPGALAELLPGNPPGSPTFNLWRGLMFWVPAMAGGIFGLLGGYLTDRLGRRRVLTWSIWLYAVSAFLSGYSTTMWMLLILRCTTFIGVCVEFVAAVAWLAELFPDREQRERVLGYTQAFSSAGGFLVAGSFLLAEHWHLDLPAILIPEFLRPTLGSIRESHATWRYTLISGLIPALPLLVIRPFLPESPVWQAKKKAGTLKRPSFAELLTPGLFRTTVVTTIMVACSYGAAFGAIQQIPQIVPGLPEVRKEIAAEKTAAQPKLDSLDPKAQAKKTGDIVKGVRNRVAGKLQLLQETGGLVGRCLLALLVVRIVSRRSLLRIFQVPGLVLVPLVFGYAAYDNPVLFTLNTGSQPFNVTVLHVGIFLVGLLTVAQFSFWGNYLPVVYPTHLRGTGESVAANVGGRMIGTSFAAVTSLVSGLWFMPRHGDPAGDPMRVALAAAGVGFFVYFVGFVASFFLPEPREEMIHE